MPMLVTLLSFLGVFFLGLFAGCIVSFVLRIRRRIDAGIIATLAVGIALTGALIAFLSPLMFEKWVPIWYPVGLIIAVISGRAGISHTSLSDR